MTPLRRSSLRLVCLAALATVGLLLFAGPALANSPWWQLTPSARPTYIQPGGARSAVQHLTIFHNGNAEVSVRALFEGPGGEEEIRTAKIPVGANATTVQAALEEIYGAGNLEVSAGPGAPAGTEPYVISFKGALADQPVPQLDGKPDGQTTTVVDGRYDGEIVLTAENLGDAPLHATAGDPVEIADRLPPGLRPLAISGLQPRPGGDFPADFFFVAPLPCSLATLTCTFTGELAAYGQLEVRIAVEVEPTAVTGELNHATISGGDALAAGVTHPITISEESPPFGIETYRLANEAEGGSPQPHAGAHPFQQTTTIALNQGPDLSPLFLVSAYKPVVYPAAGTSKDLHFNWPPGLIGDAAHAPQCTLNQFYARRPTEETLENACPADSVVGVAALTVYSRVGFLHIPVPLFNLTPAYGEPARFGFNVLIAKAPVIIDTSLRSGGDYGVTVDVNNITQGVNFITSAVTVWGTPGDPRHDHQRGYGCLAEERGVPLGEPGEELHAPCLTSTQPHPRPFLSLPTTCSGPLATNVEGDPWNQIGAFSLFPGEFLPAAPLSGCNQVPFTPTIEAEPTSNAATSPTGLNFDIDVEDEGLENPNGLVQSQIKKTVVTLPEGFTIDASLAEGLGVCSEAAYEASTVQPGSGCPEDSKVGEAEVESPLITQKLKGSIYVAQQGNNPYHNLTTLYLVLRNAEAGILIKQALKVTPDPKTGQLVTEVDNVPQLPFSHLRLALRQGQRAPLITPPACGTYTVQADLYPWSEPNNPIHRESSFQIDQGPEGKPCPQGALPFHPGFEAGTLNNQGGAYSPFSMRITRKDGEQDITKFSATLPPGVVGKIAGVAKCPQASVEAAKHVTGRQELASPSCPAASQIGTLRAGAGVGSTLVYVPGRLYLGGPYHGDPLSVVAITPAVAGPFDVGDVVVQEALTLNPVTAEVEVDGAASDPIPHSLAGIPLNLREIRVGADRPDFTLNPTSCEVSSTRATLWGGGSALFPSAETPLGLGSRFQAAGCASLGFKPKLQIKLKGGTKRGRFPALKAVVTPRAGDANFGKAVVTLPHSAFLEQGHFGTICTRVQFAAGAGNGASCPAASIYGKARAWSPLLEEVLEGPVYLRSSSHNLPDLVVALHGLVNVDLDARIDSVNGGIRSTFEAIPDAPVSRFILEMQGGAKGLIVNSTDICRGTHKAKANLTGQNGKADDFQSAVTASCGKGKAKKHRKRHKAHRRHR